MVRHVGSATMIEPIYTRIVSDIREQIRTGELKPGDELPTVAQLRQKYNCSTTAVRNAMLVLRSEHLVEGHQGKRVYVARSAGPADSG